MQIDVASFVPRPCTGDAAVVLDADQQDAGPIARAVGEADHVLHEAAVVERCPLLAFELDVECLADVDDLAEPLCVHARPFSSGGGAFCIASTDR